ncbi:hypothetical protein QA597_09900 [Marinilabiliaceae bacterium ANBcel2]|nr:hypothetical protein [Marinilabiliaceae bacterium ANBcel2]
MKYEEKPDIGLKKLIDEGLVKPDTKVYASSDEKIEGHINKDGAIILIIDGKEKSFPYPSGAARAIVNLSVNGWKFWRIRENERFVELSEIKKRYLHT